MNTFLSLKDRLAYGGSTNLEFSNAVLEEIYGTGLVTDVEGNRYPLDSAISVPHTNAIYRTIKQYHPHSALEIGMAYGASTLAILTALQELPNPGSLISIDPAQSSNWHNIGLVNVERTNLGAHHKLIEQPDYLALPALLKDRILFDFAYIDGWHTFDYTLLDFFYIDHMLQVGGIVAFNDCSLPAVKKVLGFLKTHRHYKEINVGLTPTFISKNIKGTVRNIVTRTSKQDRYFQKQETWEPPWDFFASF